MLKIAVVTPYYKESDEMLLRCHNSVLGQTHECTHILVADGFAKEILTPYRTLHIKLPKANGDYGNTPRLIGCMLAESWGFYAVAFLDADNWFESSHIEKMLSAQQESGALVVTCKRTFRHLDERVLPVTEPQEDKFRHVDTNCYLIMRPAFKYVNAMKIPKVAAAVGDRTLLHKFRREHIPIHETHLRTVNYRTKYAQHYVDAGFELPPGAYEADDVADAIAYSKTYEGAQAFADMLGFYPILGLD